MKRWIFSLMVLFLGVSVIFGHPAKSSRQTEHMEKQVIVHKSGLRLGIILSAVPEKKKNESGVEQGAYVLSVLKDSPAEKTGLKKGDIILKMNGIIINTPAMIREMCLKYKL